MRMDEFVFHSVDELKRLLNSLPEHVLVKITVSKEDTDEQEETHRVKSGRVSLRSWGVPPSSTEMCLPSQELSEPCALGIFYNLHHVGVCVCVSHSVMSHSL